MQTHIDAWRCALIVSIAAAVAATEIHTHNKQQQPCATSQALPTLHAMQCNDIISMHRLNVEWRTVNRNMRKIYDAMQSECLNCSFIVFRFAKLFANDRASDTRETAHITVPILRCWNELPLLPPPPPPLDLVASESAAVCAAMAMDCCIIILLTYQQLLLLIFFLIIIFVYSLCARRPPSPTHTHTPSRTQMSSVLSMFWFFVQHVWCGRVTEFIE